MGTEKQVFESLLVSVDFIISEVSQYIAETVTATQELVSVFYHFVVVQILMIWY
jgi:hypothetical protein